MICKICEGHGCNACKQTGKELKGDRMNEFISLTSLEDGTKTIERVSRIESIQKIEEGSRIFWKDTSPDEWGCIQGEDYMNSFEEVEEILMPKEYPID